jgi:hypothetical protein
MKPGTVTTAAVAGVTTNSVTLSFTEVNDGTGQPASYDIRWAAGTISWGSATAVTGHPPGPNGGHGDRRSARTCTVLASSPPRAIVQPSRSGDAELTWCSPLSTW